MNTGPGRLGKYELHERLGRGGSAEVWKSWDTQLQRYVAIKLLHADLQSDADFVKRFQREARVVASLHHPNIIKIHDFQVSSDGGSSANSNTIAYMVMDYVAGQTLTDYIHSTSRMGKFPSAGELIYLFRCISNAIDYAHQSGMIHRDIKPANILLDRRNPSRYQMGEPILTDFGIVKLMGTSTGTLSGWWLGTPLYISPEQAQGHPGNERSDIYSLGVILYEICTGVRPFQGDTPVSIIMQHINATPTPPAMINPRIPPALTEVILRGLAKDPGARFPSASAMTAALAQALNMTTPTNISTSPTTVDPTRPGLFQFDLPATMTPSTPSLPIAGSSTPPYLAAPPTPHFVTASDIGQNTPTGTPGMISGGKISQEIPFTNSVETSPGRAPSLPSASSPAPVPAFTRSRRGRLLILAVLVLLLVGSGLGTLYFVTHKNPSTTTITNPIVGQAIFMSSGQLNNSSQGIEDTLQINLHNISAPAAGKSYYAWLLGDKTPSLATSCGPPGTKPFIFLGKLVVDHSNVSYLYTGDAQHTNLLALTSRFLITEDNADSPPASALTNQSTWRYYAQLSQTIDPKNVAQTSILNNLRCLLYASTDLESDGIHGGIEAQLYKNTYQVWQAAVMAKNSSGNPHLIRNKVVSILDYLDGSQKVKQDVPSNTPLLVDDPLARVPLLAFVRGQNFDSYLDRTSGQLNTIQGNSNATPDILNLAANAQTAISNVQGWLGRVRDDARLLVKMSNDQLLQSTALTILQDMQTQADNAFNGLIDPSTNQAQAGIKQLHNDIQNLASFEVMPYNS